MVATVRLDENLENKLNNLAKILNKKKSDVVREAINYYAKAVENEKKSRIAKAVEKTKVKDFEIYKEYEGTLNDSL
ncbi:MAG: ribbon-helix-helix protein, CopG family [Epsilonproteobacteria bacterium]|nr:ribbon-helix-helix protein, CopG family [Campylobacterota bacterium]